MSKKKRSTKGKSLRNRDDAIHLSAYEITYEPIQDKQYRKLPREIQGEFERLHALITTDARKAIPELEGLIKQYPDDMPVLYNYLSVALSQIGKQRQAEETIRENYRRNPDYLFARLNYAEICMTRRDYQAVAETLDNKFDLKLLMPQRKRFHISEFVGFMNVIGRYFDGIGERETAEKVLEMLQEIAPDEPATQHLQGELYPNPLQQITRRLLKGVLAAPGKKE